MAYAPGLDGVRAMAVAAVLLYHLRSPLAPGGFLGVDVFFVLSGYLITSLLLAEWQRTGRIDLSRFWLGRARRLLPAAILVIAVCLLVVGLFLSSDFGTLRADALASLLYVNNWHQILAAHSYFAAFGRPSLLQHYWSLGVEEQFYVVWPVVLAMGLTVFSRRSVVVGAAVAAAASVGLMALLYRSGVDPSRAYYGTDTRAAALMIGAIMAMAWPLRPMTRRARRAAPLMLDVVGFAGLAALVLVFHSVHDYDAFLYRGGFAIVAIVAAAVIGAAGHSGSVLGLVLGSRPLRWVGQRSYGIYLWHWPVIVLTRPGIDVHWASWIDVIVRIGTVVLLAALSYRFVEMPIRRRTAQRTLVAWMDRRRPRQRLAAVTTATAIVAAVMMWVALLPAAPERSPLASLAAYAAAHPVPSTVSASAPAPAKGRPVSNGAPAPKRVSRGVLAVGSSVMLAAEPSLERRLHARVDAVVGRFNAAIIGRLQSYRDAGALPHNVVVQLGDNDPLTPSQIARLRRILRGVAHVVLVNIREPDESWETEVNATVAQTARTWPAAIVADWRDASADSNLLWDGVHPNPAGQAVYANVVARALRARVDRRAVGVPRGTMVSDSVGETVIEVPQALETLTRGIHLRLNLKICRRLVQTSCTYQGNTPTPALKVIQSLGRSLGPLLIVDVGYNDDAVGYASGIDEVMRAAVRQGVHQVIWLTLRENGNYASVYQATNRAIRKAVRRWPQLRVADWNTYSAGKPWFADDVHPNATGAVALARFIRATILRANSSTADGSPG